MCLGILLNPFADACILHLHQSTLISYCDETGSRDFLRESSAISHRIAFHLKVLKNEGNLTSFLLFFAGEVHGSCIREMNYVPLPSFHRYIICSASYLLYYNNLQFPLFPPLFPCQLQVTGYFTGVAVLPFRA